MKLLAKSSVIVFVFMCFAQISFAQKKRAPYNAVIALEGKQKVFGKITAINDTALVIVDRKDATIYVSYSNIASIKVFKNRKDIGYAAITGALAAGAVVASQSSIDDPAIAALTGTASAVGVITASILLHNVIHGAKVKIKASKEKIDYNNMVNKLSKYIVTDPMLRP